MKVIILPGNDTGLYAFPLSPRGTALQVGFAVRDNLNMTTFSFSPVQFALVSGLQNPTHGWRIIGPTIVDPTRTDWREYSLIWLYQ